MPAGKPTLPTWKWASPGYRYINPRAAGILNNEQLPSILSRVETKTGFRGTQIELLSLFKPSLSGGAVSCSSQSREGEALKSKDVQVPGSQHMGFHLHFLPSPVALRPRQRRCLGHGWPEDSHRDKGHKSPPRLSNKPPLKQNFQIAGRGPFVGHKNKLVGHKQRFKEWNRTENTRMYHMYFGKQQFHLYVFIRVCVCTGSLWKMYFLHWVTDKSWKASILEQKSSIQSKEIIKI